MRLVSPPWDAILSCQEADGRFYFSAAAELILSKHGLIPGSTGAILATRGLPWPEPAVDFGLFEGPVHPSVLAATGLSARTARSRQLDLYGAGAAFLGRLCFHRPTLRRIPPVGSKERSDPFDWSPQDRRWLPEDFSWQALDGPGEPMLWADAGQGVRYVVGRRVGNAVILGVPLLDLAVQHHAAPPYQVGYMAMRESSDLEPVERFVIDLVKSLDKDSGIMSVSLAPWPYPYKAALSIRHDFDRRMNGVSPKAFEKRKGVGSLLNSYARYGLRSTWFWRVFSYDRDLIDQVTSAGHEVALHTDVPNGTRSEIETEIAFFNKFGIRLHGYTAHGGAGSIGYIGLKQLETALANGMVYGELAGCGTTHPSYAFAIRDEVPTVVNLVMPAQHHSLDKTTRPEDHWLEEVLQRANEVLRSGGHAVVMNHPDIHIDQMLYFCERVHKEGVWHATFFEIARWFRSSRSARLLDVSGHRAIIGFSDGLILQAELHCCAGQDQWRVVIPAGTHRVELAREGRGLSWQARAADGTPLARGDENRSSLSSKA